MITREFLTKEIQQLMAQRDHAAALHQQAIGAIALAEHLLALLPPDEPKAMTLPEFAKAVGAVSAEIVEKPDG